MLMCVYVFMHVGDERGLNGRVRLLLLCVYMGVWMPWRDIVGTFYAYVCMCVCVCVCVCVRVCICECVYVCM